MRTLIPVIGLLLLAGCATTQPTLTWTQNAEGAFVCQASDGTTPCPTSGVRPVSWWDRLPCAHNEPKALGCRLFEAASDAYLNIQPAIEAIGKMK